MHVFSRNVCLIVCIAATSCARVPSLPQDRDLPLKEILLYATCELRGAFKDLDNPSYKKSFDAKKWFIGISLTPKVNADATVGIGTTGKSTTVPGAKFFNTFVIGAAPGASVNSKGHSDASVTYTIRSSALLDEQEHPLACSNLPPTTAPLARNLQIHDWLVRSVGAASAGVGTLAKIDKPTYTAQIYTKFSGNGSYTYNFPFGTAFATASGNYDRDDTLLITLTPDQSTKAVVVTMLPSGGKWNPRAMVVTTVIGQDPASRLDEIQLEQSLRNLQILIR